MATWLYFQLFWSRLLMTPLNFSSEAHAWFHEAQHLHWVCYGLAWMLYEWGIQHNQPPCSTTAAYAKILKLIFRRQIDRYFSIRLMSLVLGQNNDLPSLNWKYQGFQYERLYQVHLNHVLEKMLKLRRKPVRLWFQFHFQFWFLIVFLSFFYFHFSLLVT